MASSNFDSSTGFMLAGVATVTRPVPIRRAAVATMAAAPLFPTDPAMIPACPYVPLCVVATALPTIVGEIGGRAGMGWVFAGYTLAMTATMPIYGRLGDLQGRRKLSSAVSSGSWPRPLCAGSPPA